jgi:hypothetical protein
VSVPRHVVKRLIQLLLVVFFGLIAGELLFHKHAYFGFEKWFAFHAWFGFLFFVGVIYAGKGLRKLLKRPEDYYD